MSVPTSFVLRWLVLPCTFLVTTANGVQMRGGFSPGTLAEALALEELEYSPSPTPSPEPIRLRGGLLEGALLTEEACNSQETACNLINNSTRLPSTYGWAPPTPKPQSTPIEARPKRIGSKKRVMSRPVGRLAKTRLLRARKLRSKVSIRKSSSDISSETNSSLNGMNDGFSYSQRGGLTGAERVELANDDSYLINNLNNSLPSTCGWAPLTPNPQNTPIKARRKRGGRKKRVPYSRSRGPNAPRLAKRKLRTKKLKTKVSIRKSSSDISSETNSSLNHNGVTQVNYPRPRGGLTDDQMAKLAEEVNYPSPDYANNTVTVQQWQPPRKFGEDEVPIPQNYTGGWWSRLTSGWW